MPRFWPFDPLEIGAYDLLMIDCPWTYEVWSSKGEEKSAQAQYDCMTMEDINRLPVEALLKPDGLALVWATWPMLDQQLNSIKRWGLKYKTGGAWRKTTKHGKVAFGTGYIFRCASEPILVATKGKPRGLSKSVRNIFDGEIREHSRKPETAYEMAERLMPGARRADVFSRQQRPGWEAFGNEIQKFDPVRVPAMPFEVAL